MRQFILTTTLLILTSTIWGQNNIVHHKIYATIIPEKYHLEVTDTMLLTAETPREFLLNSALTPTCITPHCSLKLIKKEADAQDVGMDRESDETTKEIKLNKWKIEGKGNEIALTYSGKINVNMNQDQGEYQRGFSQTSGIIEERGTYLAGSTYWVPVFDKSLMTYTLTTNLPKDWKNVSQGERIRNQIIDNQHQDTWKCDKAQEEVFLIAAPFTEYSHTMNNGIKAMAFLRTPDEGLANKYLEVTEQYMVMYEEMLGKYPYSKFALVENFWETGYGMPSFTLLGEKIIRFPFILHSSYPHELLHNWWGNSVYVDFESGNWCEGLTAFMADHLIKEQRGIGEEYRRSTLQKYTNLVDENSDFPLTQFISRNDGPTEAVGYGKALMMWQMLRRMLGDEKFVEGVHLFNQNNQYKVAAYDDIRQAMEKVSGMDLNVFFKQWTTRKGAPEIAIKNVENTPYGTKYKINITLEQKQNAPAFAVDIPIHVVTEKGLETFVFEMNEKEQRFQINVANRPLKLAVDPQYDVFRILHPREVPPTLSKIWGSKNNVFVLPSKANKTQFAKYEKFAKDWKAADQDNFEIVKDSDIKALPQDKTAWILGTENLYAADLNAAMSDYNSKIETTKITYQGKDYSTNNNSFIFTTFNPNDLNHQNIFISFASEAAIPGLIRKLPHYGKYSYLGFEGDEPTNMAKGQWPVLNSPMVKVFDKNAQDANTNEERTALAELKPVLSETNMLASVKYLASEKLKGRQIGTSEIDEAAEYIANKFKEAGLQPLGEDYYQTFEKTFDGKGKIKLKNVIGIIEGSDSELKNSPVIVSAHYDHLGMGWPDVHKGDEGKIHYGADDNASGVAILLELANKMAKTAKPKRTLVFLACTAEEAGLVGSRYFVEHSQDYFSGALFANINLDTDGSLFDKNILVLNGSSATEWIHIFNGFGYTTGIKADVIKQNLDASDQVSFIENDIPAVQLFTGATAHYHRPSDTFETIDGKGMVKVATLTKGVLEYLADREDPMHFVSPSGEQKATTTDAPKKDRKASTGSVPDFAYEGEGVRIGSVVAGSPGEKAGLQEGDIIVGLEGKPVSNLKQYSDYLKQHQPGEKITLQIKRGEKSLEIPLTLGAR